MSRYPGRVSWGRQRTVALLSSLDGFLPRISLPKRHLPEGEGETPPPLAVLWMESRPMTNDAEAMKSRLWVFQACEVRGRIVEAGKAVRQRRGGDKDRSCDRDFAQPVGPPSDSESSRGVGREEGEPDRARASLCPRYTVKSK